MLYPMYTHMSTVSCGLGHICDVDSIVIKLEDVIATGMEENTYNHLAPTPN